ncbi:MULTISPECIES: triose-phosphate isomerase [unclassified Arenimonas]|uniref:triose-phosphate isomerase n=1 Tax=unclassified Arenimonas TaxID=2641713 RepID=UPI000869C1AF|nr:MULTISPECIES: triose-phosphate isomerase [unclassified Arenimonas]ODS62499.1 MAG: triose-phosphate isomerase [Arenimonas sp. SCN 70-307]
MRQRIVAGNWKLNGSRAFARQLLDAVVAAPRAAGVDLVVLPPLPYLAELAERYAGQGLGFGAQDLGVNTEGAYTGEVSGAMLRDVGARYVLVGHSERRQYHEESPQDVAEKFVAALGAGLVPVLCVGETLHQREAGQTEWALQKQLGPVVELAGIEGFRGAVVAYEPVWAIGTGRTASKEQAQEVHAFIRGELAALDATIAGSLPILYGGSVKPANAAELFAQPDVDGGLIGGASLVAQDFLAIAAAAAR